MSFAVLFRYRVAPDAASRIAFEAIYGPRGEWAGFFARGDGYKGSELLRDCDADGYVIIDRWTAADDYRRFLAAHADEYERRSASTRGLYLSEERLGAFEPVVEQERADR